MAKVNQNSTADHGAESLRMTKNAASKTGRAARKAAKAPKRIYKTAENTAKVVRTTARVTTIVISHTIAFLFNPIVLILLLVIILIILCAALLTQAASVKQAEETQVMGGAYIEMIGINDISARYPDAAEYYRIACENNKSRFYQLIDGLYYNYNDLEHSDLVYMERNLLGTVTQYERGFASDSYKATLKSAWSVPVTQRQAIAIAYVYLEMQENNAHGSEMDIYNVAFTQEVFNTIVDASAIWSTTCYNNQQCPSANCSPEDVQNPAYTTAQQSYQQATDRFNDWVAMVVPLANSYRSLLYAYNSAPAPVQSAMQNALDNALERLVEAIHNWEYVFGNRGWLIDENIGDNASAWLEAEVNAAWDLLQVTPQTIQNPAAECHLHHTLWSIGLYGYNSDTVMNTLGFTEAYKNWVPLIEYGMNTNPEFGEEEDT